MLAFSYVDYPFPVHIYVRKNATDLVDLSLATRPGDIYAVTGLIHEVSELHILAYLAGAMKPGYSKLLIFECLMPTNGAY